MKSGSDYQDVQQGAFKALVEAGVYDENFAHSVAAQEFFQAILADALDRSNKDCMTLLDCGCGPGAWLAATHDLVTTSGSGAIELFGFDITAEMIDVARRRLAGRVRPDCLKSGDVLALDSYRFPGHSDGFDVIYSYDVIQQLPPKLQFAACLNLARMLKPGGTGIVFDHDRQSRYGRIMAAKKFVTQYFRIPLVPRYYCNAKYPPLTEFARRLGGEGGYQTEIRTASTSPKCALIIRRNKD